MILWVILFLLIVAISFLLAFLSMRDYQEIPQQSKVEYGLFLIRQPDRFNALILNAIRKSMLGSNFIVSIERLFKGSKSALTIFGPRKILDQFIDKLNLLELEDYTLDLSSNHIVIWEVGIKDIQANKLDNIDNFFKNFPLLDAEDQFLWQIVLTAKSVEGVAFHSQIRAAVYSKELVRRKTLVPLLQNLGVEELVKIPRPFSAEQMLSFFKLRSLSKDSKGPVLESEQILRLLRV